MPKATVLDMAGKQVGEVELYWDGQFTRFTSVERDDR